jgi:SpoVK/Ycf46/Vps4 family AAA+-type ATPase
MKKNNIYNNNNNKNNIIKTHKNNSILKPIVTLPPIDDINTNINSNKINLHLSKQNLHLNYNLSKDNHFNTKVSKIIQDLKLKRNDIERKLDNKPINTMNNKKNPLIKTYSSDFIKNMDKKEKLQPKYNFSSSSVNGFLDNCDKTLKMNNYDSNTFSGIDNKKYFNNFENEEYEMKSPFTEKIITPSIKKQKIEVEAEINSIQDLIDLCDKYPLSSKIEYNINMDGIHGIKNDLTNLNSMIGVQKLKDDLLNQLIYFIQNLHSLKTDNSDYLHTVIYGPPGTGKTEIAKMIGKIYSKLGLLKKKTFKKATRSDLVAGYLGQTALKTRDLIKECIGGVLFIDEAYALGNQEKRDSFAKEAIDTLCEMLSDHKHEIMVIIAGYEKELHDCFFAYNDGLQSRFPWTFKTNSYDAKELQLIFNKMVKETGWDINEKTNFNWFNKNKDCFKFYGRDMENLLTKTKIAHSRRIFCKKNENKTLLTEDDLIKGFELFLSHNEEASKKLEANDIIVNMYN